MTIRHLAVNSTDEKNQYLLMGLRIISSKAVMRDVGLILLCRVAAEAPHSYALLQNVLTVAKIMLSILQ